MSTIVIDEFAPSRTREITLAELPGVWSELPSDDCFGLTWNDSGDDVIIVSVYDTYSTVTIGHDDTFYDLALSTDEGTQGAVVMGEWVEWPTRSILPRDMGLTVLLKGNDFPSLLQEYTWREQE
ncbi:MULTISPECIES: hypothetical protein [Actinoplanes]|uniref:hypothetical protein n=1 Tax=Actinoplanes TaxID=1865 RepID=UPI0005F28ED2|nr:MULTISPECIES: hypothetical protein [Actinoplanes]GLY05508.1 hypothetical protein Acsp01_58870 [Actinoplanes sp. NBRC 101535]